MTTSEQVDVHTMFGLTYANYLVLHRTLLQSMPLAWQYRFTACVDELNAAFRGIEIPDFRVQAVDDRGRFVRDPIPHYNRGRARVEPRHEVAS